METGEAEATTIQLPYGEGARQERCPDRWCRNDEEAKAKLVKVKSGSAKNKEGRGRHRRSKESDERHRAMKAADKKKELPATLAWGPKKTRFSLALAFVVTHGMALEAYC
ncbi:hypothetical protein E2562_032452 [Oryza meyeriana var. granulata]|uniref:Uncharacterized protein n=1 Tax=Oryza meyeriana var. granulata TaxID=110450 RepID=A0A6G1E696_9ORYZ|nr:hypothetical protein E2562_032452 [Oryza meyeriana var. granulata]